MMFSLVVPTPNCPRQEDLSGNRKDISDSRKAAVKNNELKRLNVDIATLQETRLADSGSLKEKDYTFYWQGKDSDEPREHGVGFAAQSPLAACMPRLSSTSDTKDEFYENLPFIVGSIPSIPCFLGDFNAGVGADHELWSSCLGQFGVGKMSENKQRLLELLVRMSLVKVLDQSFVQNEAGRNPAPLLSAGIMFVESTNNVEPTPLTMCSVESAARHNPDKQIYYFMKGFSGNLSQYPQPEYRGIPLLSSMKNVIILPLNPTELFKDTPLEGWYQKVNPEKEKFWTHVLADGCRLALLWKFGGIYLDTDIISLRSIPFANFTCQEHAGVVNNAALGFHHKHHPFIWNCMEDFVVNFIGHVWGQQGPRLITRVLKRWCRIDNLAAFTGTECNGISLWISSRFYPIPWSSWGKFYIAWKKEDIEQTFSATYGIHVWNFMNSSKKRKLVMGNGSLLEYYFQMYCPTSYRMLIH
ncbi:alpha-1,4-N-acetylglucosaminyltransferase-like [Rhinoraja longicauda]